jgi:hypothetical protein
VLPFGWMVALCPVWYYLRRSMINK